MRSRPDIRINPQSLPVATGPRPGSPEFIAARKAREAREAIASQSLAQFRSEAEALERRIVRTRSAIWDGPVYLDVRWAGLKAGDVA